MAHEHSTHSFITSPVHISIYQKIHTAGLFDLQDPKIMRSIGSPLILTVFKTIDKTQPVLPKIVASQLSLGNESNDIFFLIFSVIRHVALNTKSKFIIRQQSLSR